METQPTQSEIEPVYIELGQIQRQELHTKIINSANWFYWIAGLSGLNTVMMIGKTHVSFLGGLGFTQLIDGLPGRDHRLQPRHPDIPLFRNMDLDCFSCFYTVDALDRLPKSR